MLKKIIIIVGIIVLLILIVIGAGAYWGLSKVNSPEGKQLIIAKISESTGIDLEIEKLHIGLFSTRIDNISIPAAKGNANGEKFLQVKDVIVNYSILQLLRSPITVAKIEIDNPAVIVRQDSSGALQLPIEKAPGTAAQPEQPSGKPLTLSLPEIYVRNASATIFASDNSVLFAVKDANLQASYDKLGNSQQAKGNLKIGKATVTPGLSVTDLNLPLEFTNNKLTVSKFQGSVYNGALTGNANVNLGATPATFGTDVAISKADLSAMLADLGSDPNTIIGKLDLNFEGNGNLDAPKNLTGKGNLLIPSPVIGKLKSYQNLTGIIGTIGGVSALKEGKFDNIKTSFTMAEQKIQLTPLEVNSQNISISLSGPLGFDKSLDLKGEVDLAPGLLQVAQTVENIIGAVNAIKNPDAQQPVNNETKTPSKIKFPLAVDGTTDDPKISLDTGNQNNNAPQTQQEKNQNLINGLSDMFNKKKNNEPAPAPATQPSTPATPSTPTDNQPAEQQQMQ
ncbi:MAG: AsmA-like C-terminal region-containing protein [Verrucomicrobiales bacterium]|jgi:hypothetical protein|nr:AsmA-like C-terminal region-containing protein [Verrucomicrobiales bacterium]